MTGRRLIARTCLRCGAAYQARPDHAERSKFCSRSCRSTFVALATAERRGEVMRDRGAGSTYRKRGGRHEHRAVAEATLGRALLPGEVVHHIDGDHRNNDPANLQVMTQAEHMRVHGLGIPGQAPAHLRRADR